MKYGSSFNIQLFKNVKVILSLQDMQKSRWLVGYGLQTVVCWLLMYKCESLQSPSTSHSLISQFHRTLIWLNFTLPFLSNLFHSAFCTSSSDQRLPYLLPLFLDRYLPLTVMESKGMHSTDPPYQVEATDVFYCFWYVCFLVKFLDSIFIKSCT